MTTTTGHLITTEGPPVLALQQVETIRKITAQKGKDKTLN